MNYLRIKLRKNQSSLPLEKINSSIDSLEIISESLRVLPEKLKEIKELHSLSLNCPSLELFPDWIYHYKNLKQLKIRGTTLYQLEEASPLFKLKKIKVSHCKLDQLPRWLMGQTDLEEMDFSHNQIKLVSENISHLKKLCRINLDHNKIEKIPVSIGELKSLNHLSLDGNSLDQEEKSRLHRTLGIWF